MGAVTMENSLEVPQKAKNKNITWSRNSTPGHISKQNYNLKRYNSNSTSHNSQGIETT